MSGPAVSTMPAVRPPAVATQSRPQAEPETATRSAFPELLSKMVGMRPEVPADRQNVLDRAMSRLAAAQTATGEEEAALLAALQDQFPPAAGGEAQAAAEMAADGSKTDDARPADTTGAQSSAPATGPGLQLIPGGLSSLPSAQVEAATVAVEQTQAPSSAAGPAAKANTIDQELHARLPSLEPAAAPASPQNDTETAPAFPALVKSPAHTVGGEVTPNLTVAVMGRETHITPALQRLSSQAADTDADADATVAPVATDTDAPSSGGMPARPTALPNPQRPLQAGTPSPSPVAGGGQQPAGHENESVGHPSATADSTSASSATADHSRMFAATPSPMQQVAGRIAAAAHAMPSEQSRAAGLASARLASSPVVKVLRLELQPADLGTITIRMSLKQDGLDVRVEAGRVETLRMLQSDQEALSKILSNAGYRIEHMSVAAATFDGSAGADGRGQAFVPASGSQAWSQEADARSSGGRQNAEPDRRTFRGRQNDETEKNGTVPGAGGHLYV